MFSWFVCSVCGGIHDDLDEVIFCQEQHEFEDELIQRGVYS